jgi:hypothetical protein
VIVGSFWLEVFCDIDPPPHPIDAIKMLDKKMDAEKRSQNRIATP